MFGTVSHFRQEEKACWSGNVFMKTRVVSLRIVWSAFEHPRGRGVGGWGGVS